MIRELGLDIHEELSASHAALCGELLARTRGQGLSLGDCVCLAMAACAGSVAVTADRQWMNLHGQRLQGRDIRVEAIR